MKEGEASDSSDKWVTLRGLCEEHKIPYRYRLTLVLKDTTIQTTMRKALSRDGQRLRMVCVRAEDVDQIVNMPRPGRGAHNQEETVRRKPRPNYKRKT